MTCRQGPAIGEPLIFLTKDEVIELHARAIDTFGGSHGLRDEGALESALVAAENRHFYAEADVLGCAAAYAYHLTQAHAFIDGNKRVAAVVTEIFLEVNGVGLDVTEDQLYELYMGVADGSLGRDEVEERLRSWSVRTGQHDSI
jgi:death-on-curing protein